MAGGLEGDGKREGEEEGSEGMKEGRREGGGGRKEGGSRESEGGGGGRGRERETDSSIVPLSCPPTFRFLSQMCLNCNGDIAFSRVPVRAGVRPEYMNTVLYLSLLFCGSSCCCCCCCCC